MKVLINLFNLILILKNEIGGFKLETGKYMIDKKIEMVTNDLCEINNLDDIVFEKQDNISCEEFINFQKSTNNVIDLLISQIDVLKNEIRDLKDSNKKNSTFEKENIKNLKKLAWLQ